MKKTRVVTRGKSRKNKMSKKRISKSVINRCKKGGQNNCNIYHCPGGINGQGPRSAFLLPSWLVHNFPLFKDNNISDSNERDRVWRTCTRCGCYNPLRLL
jgi:hypothetical protein